MALVLTWLDKLFGATDAWASPKAEKNTLDATPLVLAEYPEPTEQKTEMYRVLVHAEKTPINDAYGSWLLTRSMANVSGTCSWVYALETVGGTAFGLDASLVYNITTKKIEVTVTGLAATTIKWRCARLES